MASWRNQWSIGIYAGTSPLALTSPPEVKNPVLAPRDVSDAVARSVADPFLVRRADQWYLFFEVLNGRDERGEIAYATSADGFAWRYGGIVLREPFHLSYPQVFDWQGKTYLLPETRQVQAVRLYEATGFPHSWRFVGQLVSGRYADATVVRHADRWWMFAQRGLDELRLFSGEAVEGPWREHPKSPLVVGNRRRTRPGGRMLRLGDRLIRFAQDGLPSYGNCLRAFEVKRLSADEYAERELPESPILAASGQGWNAVGMHHVDAQPTASGRWIAAVDGASLAYY